MKIRPGERLIGAPTMLVVGFFVIAIVLVILGLTAANYRFAVASPGGNDFIPRWLGTRLLLMHGQNPYSEETTVAIQQFMYGRPANGNEDQALFVYPLYSTMIFAPFAMIGDYALARAIWMTTLEMALLVLALISFRLADWKPALPVLALTLLFALIWYHGARPLINGNPAILMALFFAASLLAIKVKHDILAGILLAFATIKPQAVVLAFPLILIWAIARRRTTLLVSILLSLSALVLLALIVDPTWLLQNVRQVSAYPDYTLAGTPGDIFEQWWPQTGGWLGVTLSIMIVVLLGWLWRIAWKGSFAVLLPVVFVTLAATNLIGITTAVSNYIALFPGLILLLAYLRRDSGIMPDWPAASILALLLFGLWLIFWNSRSGREQSPIMFFPLPVLLLTTLPFVARTAARNDQRTGPRDFLST